MKTLRLVNPRKPYPTAAEVLEEILRDIRPRVRRFQRWSAWRRRLARVPAWSLEAVLALTLLIMCWAAWRDSGLGGLAAAAGGSLTAVLLLLLFFWVERAAERHRGGPSGGGRSA